MIGQIRLYIVVRDGAAPGQKAAQAAHAACEVVSRGHMPEPFVSHTARQRFSEWWTKSRVIVILGSKNIGKSATSVSDSDTFAAFFEPSYDFNLTSFAVLLTEADARIACLDALVLI